MLLTPSHDCVCELTVIVGDDPWQFTIADAERPILRQSLHAQQVVNVALVRPLVAQRAQHALSAVCFLHLLQPPLQAPNSSSQQIAINYSRLRSPEVPLSAGLGKHTVRSCYEHGTLPSAAAECPNAPCLLRFASVAFCVHSCDVLGDAGMHRNTSW
jgi:hypothetical protein